MVQLFTSTSKYIYSSCALALNIATATATGLLAVGHVRVAVAIRSLPQVHGHLLRREVLEARRAVVVVHQHVELSVCEDVLVHHFLALSHRLARGIDGQLLGLVLLRLLNRRDPLGQLVVLHQARHALSLLGEALGVHALEELQLLLRACRQLVDLRQRGNVAPDLVVAPRHDLREHLAALVDGRLIVEHSRLNNLAVQSALALRAFLDLLLDGAHRHKHKDAHLRLLADSVRPILRLRVGLRVPVRVEHYHSVCRLEVEAQAARAGAQQEDEVRRVGCVEIAQQHVAILRLGGAVQAHEYKAQLRKPVLKHVKHLCHL
mmetsp:Transcript_13572/g.42675  ORF Transcript_13572/g.42675 Transcript_13572/m.42675 type:complete len:319 (-) Transcript_13572:143-1099(-)